MAMPWKGQEERSQTVLELRWHLKWILKNKLILPRRMGKDKRSILARGSNPSKGTKMQRCRAHLGPMSGLVWLAYWVPAKRKPTENKARNRQVPNWEEAWMLFQSLDLVLWASSSQTWPCRFLNPVHYQSGSIWAEIKESLFTKVCRQCTAMVGIHCNEDCQKNFW